MTTNGVMPPKVTVMIPCYNQESFIAQAIESVLMQDYENLEVVVADDCSTDQTGEIAQRYRSDLRYRYIRNAINRGRVENYRHTFENYTHGEWVVNLDGDDYYTDKHFITNAINNIRQAQQQTVTPIVAYLYKHDNLEQIKRQLPHKEISTQCLLLSGGSYVLNYSKIGRFGHFSTLYRRDVAFRIGMYMLPVQASDFHAIIRVILNGDVLLDNRTIGVWRVHGQNTTITALEHRQQETMQTFEAIADYARNFFSEQELMIWRKRMNRAAYYDYATTYIMHKRDLRALQLLIMSFRPSKSYIKLCFRYLFKGLRVSVL